MSTPETQPGGYVLGLEAATPSGGVALASVAGRLIAHTWRADSNPIARFLLPDVDRLIRECGIAAGAEAQAIKAIAVTRGPGAFTGLRLGLALAKTLAQGWGVPVYAYSTLEMIARRSPAATLPASAQGAHIGVLLDARRGEIYSGLYGPGEGGRPQPRREERVETIAEFVQAALELFSAASFGGAAAPIVFSGSGAVKYRAELAAAFGGRAHWVAPPWDGPAADATALAGARDLREGRPGLNPLAVEPIYLRVSDAERRFGAPTASRGPG